MAKKSTNQAKKIADITLATNAGLVAVVFAGNSLLGVIDPRLSGIILVVGLVTIIVCWCLWDKAWSTNSES